MKTLYIDCSMGAAGDMLSAALLELVPNPTAFLEKLNSLDIPGVTYRAEQIEKCGIKCTHMAVDVYGVEEESLDAGHKLNHEEIHSEDARHGHSHSEDGLHAHSHSEDGLHGHSHSEDGLHGHSHSEDAHHGHFHSEDGLHGHSHSDSGHNHVHSHSSLHDIEDIVSHMKVDDSVREDILSVYRLIAQAEGHVHGKSVDEIHFHEVGTLDAIADIAAVCLLMKELAPEWVAASPVHVGSGSVHCAHGILPVPAPATAYLLRNIPSYSGDVDGELCTPTGAALLKHFVQTFDTQPLMQVEKIGYGGGKKDFARANCVRVMLGASSEKRGQVLELSCNLDDMTPEAIGFAMERLFSAGALDVYTTSIGMKKNRPGVMLTCMCSEHQRDEMLHLIFLHTTTLGIRESICNRYTLNRSTEESETSYGSVRFKKASGFGVERKKAEYEDLARIARSEGISLAEVCETILPATVAE